MFIFIIYWLKKGFIMEISFCELRAKEVVNLHDGKQLGHILDLIIDTTCSRIIGIIVPCEKSFLTLFKSSSNIFIPYHRICKIGKDVILVDINLSTQQNVKILEEKNFNNNPKTNYSTPHYNQVSNNQEENSNNQIDY